MGAGLLYAAIIVGWAAYLIPHALRRYDQASRSRSIDRFSSAMRVLGRKPGSDSVATVKPSGPPTATQRPDRAGVRASERAAARAAARRRRRALTTLLLATAVTVTVAALGYLQWWSVAIPATLTVLFLVACARRVRRANDAYWEAAAPVTRPARRVESAYGSARQHAAASQEVEAGCMDAVPATGATAPPAHDVPAAPATGRDVHPDDEPTVVLAREQLSQIAVPVETSEGDVLWDPVPVTLPTYVSKPKARRTTRTIDLTQPGTWTSGNTEEASALVEQATENQAASQEVVEEPRRAVGS